MFSITCNPPSPKSRKGRSHCGGGLVLHHRVASVGPGSGSGGGNSINYHAINVPISPTSVPLFVLEIRCPNPDTSYKEDEVLTHGKINIKTLRIMVAIFAIQARIAIGVFI